MTYAVIDDEAICARAMVLRDRGHSLRKIAEQLRQLYPDRITSVPSPSSVSAWADRGEQNYGNVHMEPEALRRRKGRRLHALMGRLYEELDQPGDGLDRMVKLISAHVLLEREESRALLPTRVEAAVTAPPGMHGPTADKIAATVAAAPVPRRPRP